MRYTIQRGDTLWALARKHGVSVDELMKLNPHITDRNKIFAGRVLNLPDAKRPSAAEASVSPPPPAAPNLGEGSAGLNIRQPLFPEAMANLAPLNPVAQDAADASQGMQSSPEALLALGAGLASNAVVKAIPALAKAMPAAQATAGKVAYPASKGAVPHAGAAPAYGNVRPVGNNPEGVAAAIQAQQGLGLQELIALMAARGLPAQSGQALGQGARMPWLGPGTGATQPRMNLSDVLGY